MILHRDEWLEARKELLEKEKEHAIATKNLARQRQALPWEKVEKTYEFVPADTPDKKVHLIDLFGDHDQLVVEHVMFEEDNEKACQMCCSWVENYVHVLPMLRTHAQYVITTVLV